MTKEQFHQWCCANLQFARSDRRFMDYVNTVITSGQPITTAQDALWTKLITKNQRQIRRQFSDDEIKRLKAETWAASTVETYSFSQVSIIEKDETIYIAFRTPYKKEINQGIQTALAPYRVRFSKTLGWYLEYSTRALSSLLAFLQRKGIRYRACAVTQRVLLQTHQYGRARAWSPMVHPSGSQWMVSNLTPTLLPALPAPVDHSIQAVVQYSQLGVRVSPLIRRRLRKEHGILVAEIAAHHRTTLNIAVRSDLQHEIAQYIRLTQPRAVILLTTMMGKFLGSHLDVGNPFVDAIAQASAVVGAPVVCWTYSELGTNNMPAKEAPLLTEPNTLIITDFSSWLENVQEMSPAKVIAVINSPQKKLLWKQ